MKNPTQSTNLDESEIEEIEKSAEELRNMAFNLGLNPCSVNYWIVDHDEINQLAAYDGFQTRYPHWRWGMKYVERKKKDTYFSGKIFELVNQDEPSNAFLQESNTLQQQKSVIAHVEAHADFFNNNKFFIDDPDAASMLERHAKLINSYYEDPSIDYDEVEEWIDAVLCIENTIDHLSGMEDINSKSDSIEGPSVEDKIDSLDISDEVKRQVFKDIDDEEDDDPSSTDTDVLSYLLKHGKQYNEELDRAEEYEDWQRTILEVLRRESYYFAAQKMTKIMNEGWAAFWESIMMTSEGYAMENEIISYADKQSAVLGSSGFNPYKIGKELWEYIENKSNRDEIIDKVLRVDGITWRNFHTEVDFKQLNNYLESRRDDSVLYEKHYSLLRPQNLEFVESISKDELQKKSRYMFDNEKYDSIEEALDDVNFEKGWNKMREVRETHNDITFIDTYLSEEFINDENYFAYDFNPKSGQYEVSGLDLDAVKKKLLLEITNSGKPTIVAADNNYRNKGQLLLKHQYNGIPLDISQAKKVLTRIFNLWGKTVNLKTIDKNENGDEQGKIISYNGETIDEVHTDDIEDIRADQIDYDTKPEEWL